MSPAHVDLFTALEKSFSSISEELDGSLVYLDEGAAEAVSLSLPPKFLFGAGVCNVCALENAALEDAGLALLSKTQYPKLTIFVTNLLPKAHNQILKCLKVHAQCKQAVIFCAYSIDAHPSQSGQVIGANAYADFERNLMQDLYPKKFPRPGEDTMQFTEQQEPSVEISVRYFPLPYCGLTPWSFVLPTESGAVKSGRVGETALGYGLASEEQAEVPATGNALEGATLLAHGLLGVASHLCLKLETFTLGRHAQQVGQEIARFGVPPAPDETAKETQCGLILVDRCMDLMAPTMHGDNLVDRILLALKRDRQQTASTSGKDHKRATKQTPCLSDIRVPIDGLCPSYGVFDSSMRFGGGAFFSPHDRGWQQYLRHLLARKYKDGAYMVRKWLREAMRKESISHTVRSKPGTVAKEELMEGASALMRGAGLRNASCIEFACATGEALDTDPSVHYEALANLEKQILMSSSPPELTQKFMDLIANTAKPQALFSFPDVLCLLIFAYSLMGDNEGAVFTRSEERYIIDAIIDVALEGDLDQHDWLREFRNSIKQMHRSKPSRVSDIQASTMKHQLRDFLSKRFDTLRQLSTARLHLKEVKRLTTGIDDQYTPIVRQIASRVYEDSTMHDLVPATSLLGGLLKMGLGRLGFQSQAKPGDQPLVIIFVVGGISLLEVREIMLEIERSEGPWKPQVILGGSSLITGQDVLGHLWK